MTEEELDKEAKEYCNETLCSVCENPTCTEQLRCREWRDRRAGYYCGAEPREKRIAELEKRCANYEMTISKMEKGTCDICKEIEKDKRITELEMTVGTLRTFSNEQATCIERFEKENKILGERCLQLQKDKGKLIDENNELKAQIEKMKADVMANIKWADKNCDNMWQKLVKMWNQWEIKEK